MFYEYHNFKDDELKIIYHLDRLNKNSLFITHLHRNLELLLMLKGSAEVVVDGESAIITENEIAIISPNGIHKLSNITDSCEYYCLIIDHSIYETWFKNEEMHFALKTNEKTAIASYKSIFNALDEKPLYYKQEVKAHIMLMLSAIFRTAGKDSTQEISSADKHRIDMTRNAITYMHENFEKDISIDDIANAVGFSKYHFCRCFKEITGQTPLWHLNYVRVRIAKFLLKSGGYNISEVAAKCGFNNPSYFCKLYKKYFNKLPKQDCTHLKS